MTSGILLNKELNILTDEFLKDGLNNITNSVKYMSKTIDDFRNFYNNKLEKKEFSIKNSIEKSLVLLSSKLMKNNVIIIKNIEDIEILGYENELIQVYMNILNNAMDSLENLKDEIKIIKITGRIEENKAYIEFLDNAGGINEEIIDKIFDSHFTTKDATKGTGIGLYMSRIIISKAKGELNVFNKTFDFKERSYKGANFIITLPLK